ncbi:putative transmembrane protein [Tieghemostelium lacteum]|uniref:Putative transmembrane protein n=1 Tax=Tieghemostelium lacteum TaxID=361077 RepID=A0A151Z601_TIELA|nr:putative transmembrane protein [Tieghemostelium lacteum]|eukprot:KYQ89375.1 putative transmembrane protein [Tieghemostelium lacteum]
MKKTKSTATLTLLLLFCLVFINVTTGAALKNHQKVGHLVKENYLKEHYKTNSHDKTKLWVFFNRKTMDDHEQYLNSNHIQLNKEAMERRRIRGGLASGSLYDYDDLPVNEEFIQHLLQECGSNKIIISHHRTSKWLNSVSVTLKSIQSITSRDNDKLIRETIDCITSKPYVERVDVVNRFVKDVVSKENPLADHLRVDETLHEDILIEKPMHSTNSRKLTETKQNAYDQTFYGGTFGAVSQINVPELQSQGYDGSGVTILMIDSGYYKDHEAFKHMKIINEYDFINNQNNTQAPLGNEQNKHGTATLSTIGGYVPGVLIGPAYNASFLLAKTEDVTSENVIEEDYWIHALEWGESLGADLVSSSLGYTEWYNYSDLNSLNAPITKAADAAVAKGMVVVVSAGNSGNRGIGAPADGKNVLAVGALQLDGKNTYFSSIGPSSDGRVKPDISALGQKNFVAYHVGPTNYTHMDGTSFACPLAAGGIALLMQAQPTWTQSQIYQAVLATSSIGQSPNIKIGYGVLNTDLATAYKHQYPVGSTCDQNLCSGHGGCCSGQCYCAPNRYGPYCQYSRVECSVECANRGGHCQLDKFGYAFNCVPVTNTQMDSYDPKAVCGACDSSFDRCGVCGGNSTACIGCDDVPYSGKVVDSCGVCGGDGICKAIIVEQPETKSKLGIIIGAAVGVVGIVGLTVGSIILYRKRRILSISSDGSMPFLKGFTPLENLDELSFSIDNDLEYE